MKKFYLHTPLNNSNIKNLKKNSIVYLTGDVYTLRDATLERIIRKGKIPFPTGGGVVYFCGPLISPDKKIIKSAGPTTTARMESYFEFLLSKGIKGFIGKGSISRNAVKILKKYKAVYLWATGGAGAYITSFIKDFEMIAYAELGPEGIFKLKVENLPLIVYPEL